jgi:acyl-homoserine lactone synthase
MRTIVSDGDTPGDSRLLRSMFEARKRVFVDLLRWNLPVLDGRFEIDQFDTADCTYIVLGDEEGAHLASARLLHTSGEHILGSLFPQLCAEQPPRGATTFENTRFCLDPRRPALERRRLRDRLVSALVDVALLRGIDRFSGVAECGWLQQILAFGWRCRPLGLPQRVGSQMLGALLIEIDESTPQLLERRGLYHPSGLVDARQPAFA